MEDIKVMPKPDWVSYDDIHELLAAAHKKNYEKGIVLRFSQMSGDEIKKYLGEESECWVAMCGDKLVGTTSVKFFKGKSWWNKGKKVAHGCFTGILKQYQGIGILEELNALKYAYIKEHDADMNQGDTSEDNRTMLKVLAKDGYKVVSFFAPVGVDHYSVKVVKWLNGCPFSDEFIARRYRLSEKLTKFQYDKGQKSRSRFRSIICRGIRKLYRL